MSAGGVGHSHRFDPVSGYCAHCGLRQDGRLVDKSGRVFRHAPGIVPALEQQHIDQIVTAMKEQRA